MNQIGGYFHEEKSHETYLAGLDRLFDTHCNCYGGKHSACHGATANHSRNLAFINGLDYAGTKPMEMNPDGRDALKNLTEADAMCSRYFGFLEEEKPPLEDIMNAHEILDKLEVSMDNCIQRVVVSLEEARKISIQKTAAPHKNNKIARNDPCPCGSGKKYKKCCWLKVH